MNDRDIIKMRRYASEDLDNRPHMLFLDRARLETLLSRRQR